MSVTIKPLEYSKETLDKRIASIRLINIQGVKDITIDLPESGIIRIHSPSEVGKTSLFRPFEAMVTSRYNNKQEIASLVSKGCRVGELIVKLINGTFVALHLDTTNLNKCCYGIQYPGKPLEQLPYPQGLPKILEVLGWYSTGVNDKLDFSLNVRLKGMLPIIDTPKRLNTEVFKVALNDSDLERTYGLVNQGLDDIKSELNSVTSVLEGAKFALDNIHIEDTEPLKNELRLLEQLEQEDILLSALEESITQVFTASSRKPNYVKAPSHVIPLITKSETYTHLTQTLDNLLHLNKPNRVVSPKEVEPMISQFKVLSSLQETTNSLIESSKPNKVTAPRNLEKTIQLHGNLGKLARTLCSITQEEKPKYKSFDKETLSHNIELLDELSKLQGSIDSISQSLSRKPYYVKQEYTIEKLLSTLEFLESCNSNLELLNSKLGELHSEMSKYQCPTCGQYYSAKHSH